MRRNSLEDGLSCTVRATTAAARRRCDCAASDDRRTVAHRLLPSTMVLRVLEDYCELGVGVGVGVGW